MATPVPQDFFEVTVKGSVGSEEVAENYTKVEVKAKVLLDGTNEPFKKANNLYRNAVWFSLNDANVPLTEATLKLWVYDDNGFSAQVTLLTDTGATPPVDPPVPVPAPM